MTTTRKGIVMARGPMSRVGGGACVPTSTTLKLVALVPAGTVTDRVWDLFVVDAPAFVRLTVVPAGALGDP